MQDNISSTENGHIIELLSAYVDGRVTTVERLSVETHLASCAGCRNHLRSLQATVALLHDLPVVPAPRSFYIYPNMVPQKRKSPLAALFRPSWAFGALRLAASVASMLLVIVLAVDALGPVGSRGAAAPMPSALSGARAPERSGPDAMPSQTAYASAALTAPTQAASAATAAPAAPVVGAASVPSPEAAREALPTTAPAATVAPSTAATPAPSAASLPPGAATQFSVGPLAPTAVPTVSAKALTAATPAVAAGATPSPATIPSADAAVQSATVATPTPSAAAAEVGKVLPLAPQPFSAPTTESAQPSASANEGDLTSPLRALEVGLAALVVALVALALLVRRAS